MTMALATQERQKASEAFVMPRVSLGDVVLWYSTGQGNERPAPGIVIGFSPRQITVLASIYGRGLVSQDCIRHRDDPEMSNWDVEHNGFWDYTDFHKRVMALESTVTIGRVKKEKEVA